MLWTEQVWFHESILAKRRMQANLFQTTDRFEMWAGNKTLITFCNSSDVKMSLIVMGCVSHSRIKKLFTYLLIMTSLTACAWRWMPLRININNGRARRSGQRLIYGSALEALACLTSSHRRRLRSSTDRSCAVPRTHNTFGDRSFAVAGPRVWNSLPAHLRDEDITYNSFRRELKTFLF